MITRRSPVASVTSGVSHLFARTPFLALVFLGLVASAFTVFIMTTMGLKFLPLALAGILGFVFLLWVSGRNPEFVMMAWFVSMSGFHTIGMVRMPGMPDFSFARLLMIWVLMMLLFRFIMLGRKPKGPYGVDLVITIYTFYVMFQLMYFDSHQFHSWYLSCLAPLLAYFYGKNYINKAVQIRNLLVLIMVLLFYYSLTSVAEHWKLSQLVWPKVILDENVGKTWWGRTRGPFLQSALFGQMIGIFALVHFFLLSRRIAAFWKLVLVGSLVVCSLGLFYTYTRGGWLATAMGIVTLAVLRPRYRKMLFAIALLGVVAGGLGVLQPSDDEFLQERMENTGTIENRLGFLAASVRMIQDHPVFGVGYFKYNDLRDQYVQGTYIPFYGFVKRSLAEEVVIHDIYLGRMAEEGTISIFMLSIFLVLLFKRFQEVWRQQPNGRWFNHDTISLFAAMIVCYLVGGLAIDYRYFDLINVIPYLVAGIVNGYERDLEDDPLPAVPVEA